MRGTQRVTMLLVIITVVILMPLSSAHGDEASSGLKEYQVLGIALATALLLPLFMTRFGSEDPFFPQTVFSLAVFTGMVHILLGINDRILLIGGISVIGILLLSLTVHMDDKKSKSTQYSLSAVTITMFIGYFVSNHDLHYVLEDYLGIATKISEIALLVCIYRMQTAPINGMSAEESA